MRAVSNLLTAVLRLDFTALLRRVLVSETFTLLIADFIFGKFFTSSTEINELYCTIKNLLVQELKIKRFQKTCQQQNARFNRINLYLHGENRRSLSIIREWERKT